MPPMKTYTFINKFHNHVKVVIEMYSEEHAWNILQNIVPSIRQYILESVS